MSMDRMQTEEGGQVAALLDPADSGFLKTHWLCEQWSQEACEFAMREVEKRGALFMHKMRRGKILVPTLVTAMEMPSQLLRRLVGEPEVAIEIPGNLLLNEGLGQLTNLLIGGTANAYDNTNSFIGVGDTNTAAAASQTELQATQNAANRFYKGMVATYPQRSGANNETIDWRSDFTGTEANFAWQEWTVARGATTASGSGFLVGTVNLNRKVQSLGTKAAGTWTMTGSITFS